MNIVCSPITCPLFLSSACVFYEGDTLTYTNILKNDSLQTALEKIDAAFADAGIGFVFQNGIEQENPGDPVELGGSLLHNTQITGNYRITLEGQIESSKFITTGGLSSQFVKGDGTLDSTTYQPTGNYITALTGDGTANGPGSVAFTLATVNLATGTWGNATTIPQFTVNGKGLITNVVSVPVVFPENSLSFGGDVTGSGMTGSLVTLTLQTVNSNVFGSNTPLKFAVNGKGLVTSAAALTNLDLDTIYGYTPVPNTRQLTINGVTYDLANDRSWTVSGGHIIQDEGIDLPNRTNLNFVGANVTVTDDAGNDATVVTISGGGSAVWGAITGTVTDQTDLITYISTNYYPLSSNPAGYLVSADLQDLTISTGLQLNTGTTYNTSAARTISIDGTVVTLTGAQALSNKTGLISQWTNDIPYLTSSTQFITSILDTVSVDLDVTLGVLTANILLVDGGTF